MGDIAMKDLRVLVVDDNEPMRLLLRKMLADLGISNVATAHDGIEALKVMNQSLPDLVITDQQMEPLDGVHFVQELRTSRDERVRNLRVIMMTGHMGKDLLTNAVKVGVDDFLAKPISPTTLKQRIQKLL